MSITLTDTHINFYNKISKSTTMINGKQYEKYMAYFPNVLYEYLGKPEHIYLKREGNLILISKENGVDYVEKRLYEVGTNSKTYNFIIPKRWVGDPAPTTISYIFDFAKHDIMGHVG